MAREVRSAVAPGQRFKQNSVTWEIEKLRSIDGIPHAKIVKIGDPTERKLISVRALLDGYDIVPE